MARRPTTPPSPQPANLTVEQMQLGISRIARRIADLESFDPTSIQERWSSEVGALQVSIDETLVDVFGPDTLDYRRYRSAVKLDHGPVFMGGARTSLAEVHRYLINGRQEAITLLRQAVRGLEEKILDLGQASAVPAAMPARSTQDLNKVFVVHGHDEGAREAIARFLERLGIRPIILHEQANKGRTVIEKVEAHGDVGFAVVLLTPDDEGAVKGEAHSPRARQNVILELGYFIGRLGRSNVCALKRGDIEIPSDFGGVVYETFDSGGGWMQVLARELQEAGFQIDWNVVMRA